MKTQTFLDAFDRTMKFEGMDSNDPVDSGGKTYRGISMVHWPNWAGWSILTRVNRDNLKNDIDMLDMAVKSFYRDNFWNQLQCEAIAEISPEVASEIFDTSVNMGVNTGGKILQEALNLLNLNQRGWPDLFIDGSVGAITIETLRKYCSGNSIPRLLRVMNALQAERYINLMRKYPEREKFRGWFDRI